MNTPGPIQNIHRRWFAFGRKARITILIIVVVLLAVRLALPYAIKAYVNRQLDNVPEYGGHIGDVEVALWRGAYQIHAIQIVKTTGNVPVPFFSADLMDLSLEWKELFHGALVGEVRLTRPQLNFVAAPTPEDTQIGKDRGWGEVLESLFPFKLNRFEIGQGQVHFRNFHSSPPVNVFVTNLFATATNLTNTRELGQKLPATVTAHGQTPDGGDILIALRLNPLAPTPTFELDAQLTNANLVAMNDLLKAYGKFDVERGRLDLFTSTAVADNHYEGYVKILFQDLDVFAWEKERQKNVLQVFWQAIVGAAAAVFKNHPRDQLATKIPFSGKFEQTDVGVWTAVSTLLENAFIRALLPKLDQPVKVDEVEQKAVEEKITPEQVRTPEPIHTGTLPDRRTNAPPP